ncbi:MAG: radical SAM protein [Candidatus Thorarchaeota archaeon]
MKVALINAPRPVFKGDGSHLLQPYLPLAISHLNGYLNNKKIETEMIDLNTILMGNKELFYSLNKIDGRFGIEKFISKNQDLVKKVVDYLISKINIEDCKILGISIIEHQSIKIILPFLNKIKEMHPDKKIVIGGEANWTGEDKIIDFVVNGRGEGSLLSIIRGVQNKISLPRVFNNESDHYIDVVDQVVMFNGNQIDNCRYIQERYVLFNDLFNAPILPYKLGKGCLYRCSFCTNRTKKVSYKEPEQIVEDLKKIIERFHYKYFFFLHEHLTISKPFIHELCDRIIDSKLDILWSDCIKPLSYLSQNLYNKLRESGCVRLSYGIETGSPRIMKLMNKGHSVSDCEKNLRYAHKAGIFTEAAFIIGFPTEGEKEFNETLDFVKRNKDYLDILGQSIFRLHGNTSIIKNPEKYGIQVKKEDNWTLFVRADVYGYDEIGGLTYEKLQKLHKSRHEKLSKTWSSLKRDNYAGYLQTLVFPLFDLFGSKDKVIGFLKENSDILPRSRIQNRYHSLFTGALSNQKIKGNLHHCWTNKFRLVPFDKLIKRLQEIYNRGFIKLIVTGGEPLIRKDIFKILSKAKEIGFEYIIVKTNARMLKYKNFCERLSNYVDEILVINPSEDEKEYESISGVKGSYSQGMEGIKNWKKLNKKIRYYS